MSRKKPERAGPAILARASPGAIVDKVSTRISIDPHARATWSPGPAFTTWRDDDLAACAAAARDLVRVFGSRAAVLYALRSESVGVKFGVLLAVVPRDERRALLDDLDGYARTYWKWRLDWSDWLDERLALLA